MDAPGKKIAGRGGLFFLLFFPSFATTGAPFASPPPPLAAAGASFEIPPPFLLVPLPYLRHVMRPSLPPSPTSAQLLLCPSWGSARLKKTPGGGGGGGGGGRGAPTLPTRGWRRRRRATEELFPPSLSPPFLAALSIRAESSPSSSSPRSGGAKGFDQRLAGVRPCECYSGSGCCD